MWNLSFAFMVSLFALLTQLPAASPTPSPTPMPVIQTPAPIIPTLRSTPRTPPPILIPTQSPQTLSNHLYGPHGLNTAVGSYADCTGKTVLIGTAIDVCAPVGTYFVGHNLGPFTPLMSYQIGDVITYNDGNGTPHHLRVIAIRDNFPGNGAFPSQALVGEYGQLQTCETGHPDGSLDRILDVVAQ